MVTQKALSGVRVVEYGNFISAPYCTKLMADLGAEVIKVEHPDLPDESRKHGPFLNDVPYPERSGLFLYLNTNKMGITLNLETITGREILMQILKDADIFVENSPVQYMKDLSLDYASIMEVNQLLIMTSITPFGETGPYRDYKAYDINVQAGGGATQGLGLPDREPLAVPLSQSGYQAGLCGAISSLAALWARETIGRGQHIDIAETEVWATIHTGWDVLAYIYQWRLVRRTGHHGQDMPYPGGAILPCKDGYVAMSTPTGREWRRFLELLGNPEWAKDPRFKDRTAMNTLYADEVDALLSPWLMERTKEEIFALGRENRLAFGPMKTIDEEVNDPHLAARGFWVDIDRAGTGVLKYPGACYRLSETPWRIDRPAPLLGEHNELIYCGRLGYSKQELVQLHRGGII